MSTSSPSNKRARHSSSDSDSDIEILPSQPPPSQIALSQNVSNCIDIDDDEGVITHSTLTNPNISYPHSRFECGVHLFSGTKKDKKRHCDNCYCYVCDVRVSDCKEWNRHCVATNIGEYWKKMRQERKNARNRGIPYVSLTQVTMQRGGLGRGRVRIRNGGANPGRGRGRDQNSDPTLGERMELYRLQQMGHPDFLRRWVLYRDSQDLTQPQLQTHTQTPALAQSSVGGGGPDDVICIDDDDDEVDVHGSYSQDNCKS
mmetsp:Transcript_18746/g.23248  ORF Transcript_18746/g.23248 Transcript_18746/m.23248 type:complete len:258 (+) Transcript_18746:191-964(+)|eukprot:CAMPEP_0172481532 /NCGR_PEP_ID=MMETSP1066-20121228/7472_1 /TAXON_ID=671091 /ORGANISM="Coscinodiscus wailesii, Strain CCMP2513" /LENGTH=257 /DNA_ID=CAMNT_0013243907 /DNA_START=191 /DNA_END=964 /DNA_ORIENTATION=+